MSVANTCTVDCFCTNDWNLKELEHYLKDISIRYKHELQHGILEEALLDYMLKQSNCTKNIVLAFLEKFHLAVEIDRSKFKDEDDSYRTPDTGSVLYSLIQ